MSQNERSGVRDLLYSQWHRAGSTRTFLGARVASLLKVVDIDWCEACQWCNRPLALIETQCSAREPKSAAVTQALARMAGIPAYSVSYTRVSPLFPDIAAFQVRQLVPESVLVEHMSPAEYAAFLWSLRDEHHGNSWDCATKSSAVDGGAQPRAG